MPRQMLFLSFRALYQSFRSGSITKDQAHKEKLKLLKTYGDAERDWKIYQETAQMRNRLSRYLAEIEKGGCDKCRLAVKIWDGRARYMIKTVESIDPDHYERELTEL